MLDTFRPNLIARYLLLAEGEGEGEGGTAGAPPKVTFTPEQHDEINRIVTARSAEAARKAAKAREDEIDTYLAEQKTTADREKLDEVERLKAEKADAEARATEATASAARVALDQRKTTLLVGARVDGGFLTDAMRLLDVTSDDDDTAAAAKVTALVERLPALFGASEGTGTPPAPPKAPTPPGHKPSTGGGQSAKERAAARFRPQFAPPAA